MRHEKEKGGGHVCSFEREHEVISFANFFPLPRVCTRMSGIMNYRVCLLDTFSFPAPCFILLYTPRTGSGTFSRAR